MALPNETLAAILSELPPPSLAAVACVSVRFNAVAERILYASVYIAETLSEASPLPYRTLHWCEAMRRRPHLFDAARRLHIRWQSTSPPTQPSPYLPSACDELARVLRHLSLLESLDLFLGPANLVPATNQHPPLHAVERAVAGCRFAQLRACALGADAAKGAQAYTRALGAFLGALPPALRALRLDLAGAPPGLSPRALPSLTHFRGSADAAAALLPGRPVRALALVGDDADVTRENLPRMAATAGALRALDLSAMPARPLLLRNVSTHLPAVESLRVRLALRHTLHYSFSGIVSRPPPRPPRLRANRLPLPFSLPRSASSRACRACCTRSSGSRSSTSRRRASTASAARTRARSSRSARSGTARARRCAASSSPRRRTGSCARTARGRSSSPRRTENYLPPDRVRACAGCVRREVCLELANTAKPAGHPPGYVYPAQKPTSEPISRPRGEGRLYIPPSQLTPTRAAAD